MEPGSCSVSRLMNPLLYYIEDLLGELVCSFTLQSASCCHQDELNIRLLHGGAFLQNATSCSGAVEVGCAHPHSHV